MSTEKKNSWVLCRSYKFPNKFYYFNVRNGESKWVKAPEEKTLLNSSESKDLGITFKLNNNSGTEPNKKPDEDVASLMGSQVFYRESHSNCNKQVFERNIKSLPPLFSQDAKSTSFATKENRQMFHELIKKKGKKKSFIQAHGSFSPPYLNDNVGRFNFKLNDTQEGQNPCRICSECGSYKEQNEDSDLPISLITNKMDHINIEGSTNVMTAQNEDENFIEQHNQKWFIFRSGSQNKDRLTVNGFDDTHIKLQPFGRNMKPLTRNREPKPETVNTCFIIVDLNVLLNDFQYINNNILQDQRYCLVIPYGVLAKLQTLAEMNHKSRQLMTTAQNLIWEISTETRHIILEPKQPVPSTSQQIISCCKKIQNLNYSLILLTNDADLYASAIDHNLECYILQEIKDGLSGPLFDSHPKYTQNEDINNNIFLQKPNNIKPFDFTHLSADCDNPGDIKDHRSSLVYDLNHNDISTNNIREEVNLKEKYVNEKLKKFYLKNRQMAGPIILRVEDYMCTFTQIMETFIADLLLNENVNLGFCTIPQAVDAIVQLYPDCMPVKITAYRMSALYNLINQNGKLETNSKADILIKMVGCGIILVESIKAIKPNSEILLETEYLLSKLLQSIEDPERIENEMDPAKVINTYDRYVSETTFEYCGNRPGDDVDYLNGDFTEHNANEQTPKQTNFANNRIIRTTGRNLNSLRISNKNIVTLDVDENCDHDKLKEENKNDTKINAYAENETPKRVFDSTVHENAFNSELKIGPKVILNFGTIKSFEERLGNKSKKIDTKKTTIDTRDELNSIRNKQEECVKDKANLDKLNETYTDVAYQTGIYINDTGNDKCGTDPVTLSASNDDSGLGKEYCDVYLVVKKFISDMSTTLNVIYEFIKETSVVLKNKDMKEEQRREIFDKAYRTYQRTALVVDDLKNIMKRENGNDKTVKSLLEGAGVDVTNDNRITGYKKIVTTYLEQVDILRQALKIIYIATNSSLLPAAEVTC